MFRLEVPEVVGVTNTLLVLRVAVSPLGAVGDNMTFPVKPFTLVTVMVESWDEVCNKVRLEGLAVMLNPWTTKVPFM